LRQHKEDLFYLVYAYTVTHVEIDESLLDFPINELIKLHPEVVSLMLSSQMDCVGCDFDRFHSLRTALDLYGIDHDDFVEKFAASVYGNSGGKS